MSRKIQVAGAWLAAGGLVVGLALACGGGLSAAESVAKSCGPAMQNMARFEAARVGPKAEQACAVWYGNHASEVQIRDLECMAGAADAAAFKVCRGAQVQVPPPKRVATVLAMRGPMTRGSGPDALSGLGPGGIGGLIGSKGLGDPRIKGVGGLGGPSAEGLGGLGSTTLPKGLADAVVDGGLEPDVVKQVIRRSYNQIRYCYQRQLVRNRDLGGGELDIDVVIDGDGKVSGASASRDTIGDASITSCVEGRFVRMRFPASADGKPVKVKQTLVFEPG